MTAHEHHNHHETPQGGGCHSHQPTPESLASVGADEITECPVMVGTAVIKSEAEEAGLSRDYNGQRYWLCCASCGPLFDADPERYVAA